MIQLCDVKRRTGCKASEDPEKQEQDRLLVELEKAYGNRKEGGLAL